MNGIKLIHKLGVHKDGCAPYDVAVGDVVTIRYLDEEFGFEEEGCTGRITGIDIDSIEVDCSDKYASNMIAVSIPAIIDIKAPPMDTKAKAGKE